MGCSDKISVVVKNVIETIIIQKDGWLQYFELIPHENGFVFRLKDYFGGEGEKPTEFIGWYMGADGWVEDIEDSYVIGEKGEQVQIRNNGEFIQWKYESDAAWSDIVSLQDLKGDKGDQGFVPYIGVNENWWINGIDTGFPSRGEQGDEPEITIVGGIWFVNGISTGQEAQGEDGREIEIRNDGTDISWRYIGDVNWVILVPLVDLKGDKGDDGDTIININPDAEITSSRIWIGTQQQYTDQSPLPNDVLVFIKEQ